MFVISLFQDLRTTKTIKNGLWVIEVIKDKEWCLYKVSHRLASLKSSLTIKNKNYKAKTEIYNRKPARYNLIENPLIRVRDILYNYTIWEGFLSDYSSERIK